MPVAAMLNPVYISSETFDAMNLNIGKLRRDLHTSYQSISVYGTEIYEKTSHQNKRDGGLEI